MAIFSKNELDLLWKNNRLLKFSNQSSDTVLREAYKSFDSALTYDIFLSHSYKDKDTIIGLSEFIKSLGYLVYIDWIDDSELDRSKVTKETAQLLRERMKNCRCLFYVTSENYLGSKWMPWELGYFDGLKSNAAIVPISEGSEKKDSYISNEYLGIYPYITKNYDTNKNMSLWVKNSPDEYIYFEDWLNGEKPYKHKGV
jgi:hypothetical protein